MVVDIVYKFVLDWVVGVLEGWCMIMWVGGV